MVRRQADHLRGRQVLARGARRQRRCCSPSYTDNVTSIDTPDDRHGRHPHQAARRADRRRPVHLHPAQARLGQGAGQGAHRLLPAGAAAGRQRAVHRHRVRARPHPEDGAQPELPRARSRRSTRSSSSSTATRTPSSGRCSSARSTWSPEVQPPASSGSASEPNIETVQGAVARRSPQLAFNLCPKKNCPDAKFNPAVQDRAVRQAIAYAIDRERINEIAARDTSFAGHGILPDVLQVVLRAARRRTTRSTPTRPTRCSTTPAG